MGALTYPGFDKNTLSLIIEKALTFIYQSIENFAGYKMVCKTLRPPAPPPLQKGQFLPEK